MPLGKDVENADCVARARRRALRFPESHFLKELRDQLSRSH